MIDYKFIFTDKDISELKAFNEELESGDSVLVPLVIEIVKGTWWYKDLMKYPFKIKYKNTLFKGTNFSIPSLVNFIYRIVVLKDSTIKILY